MKPQKFFPRQVLRRLQGEHAQLSPNQTAALRYLARRGRQLGYSLAVMSQQAQGGVGYAAAHAVMAHPVIRIILSPAV